MHQANHTWLKSVRRHLRKILLDELMEASKKSKQSSFLSHPIPECSCMRYTSLDRSTKNDSSPSPSTQLLTAIGGIPHRCPVWMSTDSVSQSKEKENDDDLDDDDSTSSGLFFGQTRGHHEGDGELNNKEENQLEDQEDLDGGDR